MSGTFPGRIVLLEGDEVDVDLQIAAEKIRLATPFAEIGLWDRDAIRFQSNSSGGYELSVGDDVVTFYPADTGAFAEAVDEMLVDGGDREPEIHVAPVSAAPDLPVVDEDPPTAGQAEPEVEASEAVTESASGFGPSSRERLAAAMSGFRERQTEDGPEDGDQEPDDPGERSSSSGFVIPGDEGYSFPTDEDHDIEFDEEVGESTVADEILESQRSLRSATSVSFDKARLRPIAIAVVAIAVVAGLAFAVPVVLDFFAGSEETTPATVVQTTVPVTQAPTTVPGTTAPTTVDSTVAGAPLVFDLAPDAFVERWNENAAGVSPNLRFRSSLPASEFEVGFTGFIAMIGSFDGQGEGIAAYTLEVDPTGPSSSDQLGIQALGLAIAVADPSLEPAERGAVLGAMGLNVRDPQLGGLDGRISRNGVDYRLLFDQEDLVLRLTISPQV